MVRGHSLRTCVNLNGWNNRFASAGSWLTKRGTRKGFDCVTGYATRALDGHISFGVIYFVGVVFAIRRVISRNYLKKENGQINRARCETLVSGSSSSHWFPVTPPPRRLRRWHRRIPPGCLSSTAFKNTVGQLVPVPRDDPGGGPLSPRTQTTERIFI